VIRSIVWRRGAILLLGAILAANPWIRDPSLITPGVRIDLPGSDNIAIQTAAGSPGIPITGGGYNPPQTGGNYLLPETGGTNPSTLRSYTVFPGDTLSELAIQFGVPVSTLMQYNPAITDPNQIYAGQAIFVP